MTTLTRVLRPVPVLAAIPLLAGLLGLSLRGEEAKPKKYALLVGITEYKHASLRPLRYTANDATDMAELLRKYGYEVVVLTNTEGKKDPARMPTKANIERELKKALRRCDRGDLMLVGLSGHGVQFDETDSYFCPADARPFADETDTLVSLNGLYREMEKSYKGPKVLLVDACRNNPSRDKGAKSGIDANSAPRPPVGVVALFSCSAEEKSFESDKVGHGVFFHFVLEGLKGEAKDFEGDVTWGNLTSYVNKRVPRAMGELVGEGAIQTPNRKGDSSGALILLRPGDAGALAKKIENSIKMQFVLVPAGTFTMGSPEGEGDRGDDETQHEVEITRPFYMGIHEVTQGQFETVMGYNPSYFSASAKGREGATYFFVEPGGGADKVKGLDTASFPVENVSWEEAREFCEKLSAREEEKTSGRGYRLPTDAEWEYSCREGGSAKAPFHFGNILTSDLANFDGRAPYGTATKGRYLGRTSKVGSYKPNALGLYDMHGNVSEWCHDWYDREYYSKGPHKDPSGPTTGDSRVQRGGGWNGSGHYCRAAGREWSGPKVLYDDVGFRIVCLPPGTP